MNKTGKIEIPLKLAEDIYRLLMKKVNPVSNTEWDLTEHLNQCIMDAGGYSEENQS